MAKIPAVGSWQEYGVAETNPTSNKERAEIEVDEYYVVVCFEVNNPEAYVNETQDLAVDYGHAFFYIVKNGLVSNVFSFGPAGDGKDGWFNQGNNVEIDRTPYGVEPPSPSVFNRGAIVKDSYKNARQGTASYAVERDETTGLIAAVSAFAFLITLSQGRLLEVKTEEMIKRIDGGIEKYSAIANDTCAETARDLLSDSGIETPSGSGEIKHSDFLNFPIAYAVNPYKWHSNFLKKFGKNAQAIFTPPWGPWLPQKGARDPIFAKVE